MALWPKIFGNLRQKHFYRECCWSYIDSGNTLSLYIIGWIALRYFEILLIFFKILLRYFEILLRYFEISLSY